MNKFETGIGDNTKNIPSQGKYIKEEKIEDGFEDIDIAKELQMEENRELSTVETKKSIASRLRKAVCAITAGVILMSATPAFAKEKGSQLTEKQKIELTIQKLEEQKMQLERQESEVKRAERMKEISGYLNYFNLDGLELGRPKMMVRCPCEQFGVYLKGKHLGDIYSDSGFIFPRQELIDDVLKTLEKNGFRPEIKLSGPHSPEAIDAKINVTPEAQEVLKKWGGKIKDNIIDIGNPDEVLELDGNTKSVDISSVMFTSGDSVLYIAVENYDGSKTIVTCRDKKVFNIQEFKK